MTKIIGIDLGTSTACVSIMEGGEPKVIENSKGKRTTPAIVAFTDSGERLVGQSAEWCMTADPARTLFRVRRLVGRKFSDPEVRRFAETSPFEIVPGPDGDAAIKVADRIYSPVVPLAMMLGKMKRIAEEYLGETVTEAVVTVPAHFNFAQIQAVKDAGKIAGLNVQRTVPDAVAAALAYGLDKTDAEMERIAVLDLGGGSFDISILEIGDGVFVVKSTNGDTFLGGEEFDRRIVNWLADEFKRENGIDLRGDAIALQRLKNEAEKAKKALSTAQETDINLPFITVNGAVPKNLNVKLSRTRLEALTADLIDRCEGLCRAALQDAELSALDIDEVILVGGMTRMPKVREKVKTIFGKESRRSVNPDEAAAMGAAIQAGVLKGDVKGVLLLDTTPLSLGIETLDGALSLGEGPLGGVMTRLIEKNNTVPTKKSQVFSTAADNQSAVSIHVLQGEREMAQDNKSVGRFDLADIPPAPRGVPQIEVTFDLDANGILSVSAKDLGTGKERSIRITASSGLVAEGWQVISSQNEPHESRTGVNGQGRQMEGMVENILLDLLPTVDNLDRALSQADQATASVDAESRLKGMFEGVRLIRKGLLGTLERFGVTPLESLGRPFNPEEQEAISMAADTVIPANHIVREFVRGYRFNGRMLRHAQVVVSSGPPK